MGEQRGPPGMKAAKKAAGTLDVPTAFLRIYSAEKCACTNARETAAFTRIWFDNNAARCRIARKLFTPKQRSAVYGDELQFIGGFCLPANAVRRMRKGPSPAILQRPPHGIFFGNPHATVQPRTFHRLPPARFILFPS